MQAIEKQCAYESIMYCKIDDDMVVKNHYDANGNRKRQSTINIRVLNKNRCAYLSTDDFFLDMIDNHGYSEVR